MPFAPFQNENLARDLPQNGKWQAGVSNFDPDGTTIEQGVKLPWTADPDASWMYYDVAILCQLDSGIVVHRRMPQVDNTADTLASCAISDPSIDKLTGRGVNTVSNDQFQDIVQRMAHSRYWFRLFGQAMRVGYQVPIPGLKTVCGVPAIPYDDVRQVAYNKIVGNYSGIPLWYAPWSLWYTVAVPPLAQQVPPANLAAHIAGDVKLPEGVQAPFSQPDDEAQNAAPPRQRAQG